MFETCWILGQIESLNFSLESGRLEESIFDRFDLFLIREDSYYFKEEEEEKEYDCFYYLLVNYLDFLFLYVEIIPRESFCPLYLLKLFRMGGE